MNDLKNIHIAKNDFNINNTFLTIDACSFRPVALGYLVLLNVYCD